MKTLIEWCKWGGLIGIGISMMFLLTFEGSFPEPLVWFYYALFGLTAGVLITVGNLFTETVYRYSPASGKLFLLIQLLIRYLVSATLFYLNAVFFKAYIFNFFPNRQALLGTTLAVGVASVMIGLFWGYAAEKDERIKLEIENRKLAVVEERNRIARELHDSVSQNLFGISLNLNTLKYRLEHGSEQVEEILEQLREMVTEIQTEMRLMIYELQPAALTEKGFFEAVEDMVGLFRRRYRLEINYHCSGEEDQLDGKRQLVLYRVLQEALNNVVRHAGTDKVKISMEIVDGHGELTVRDEGKGFNLTELSDERHLGVRGMRERVNESGGEFRIESAPNQGTTINVWV